MKSLEPPAKKLKMNTKEVSDVEMEEIKEPDKVRRESEKETAVKENTNDDAVITVEVVKQELHIEIEPTEEENGVMENQDTEDIFADYAVTSQQSGEYREYSRGLNMENVPRVGRSVPAQMPRVEPSKKPPYHTVCVNVHNLNVKNVPSPFPAKPRDAWDARHVRMPWSPQNEYPVQIGKETRLLKRWDMITNALKTLITKTDKPSFSADDIKEAIISYNTRFAESYNWSFDALKALYEDFSEEEKECFKSTLLPGIVRLCLDGPRAITSVIPLIRADQRSSITLSQYQISVLLANAFFCTFPRRNNHGKDAEYRNYPDINFNRLLSLCQRRYEAQLEKLKTIVGYFRQVIEETPVGLVTFTRQVETEFPDWKSLEIPLEDGQLRITSQGIIEVEGDGMLQVDFANRFVGGGVLAQGLVQEEIRFIICPDLIVSRLFTEALSDNEVLVIHGCQQFSRYSGYGDAYKYEGKNHDTTEFDIHLRRNTTVVAMDASRFTNHKMQFTERYLIRELNKAFVGFQSHNPSLPSNKLSAVATGNWGCGAFRGNMELKFLLQLMVVTVVGRKMCYFTFGDDNLVRNGYRTYQMFLEHKVTVGQLYRHILLYESLSMKGETVFEYIERRLNNNKESEDLNSEPVQNASGSSAKHSKRQQTELKYNAETDDEESTSQVDEEAALLAQYNVSNLFDEPDQDVKNGDSDKVTCENNPQKDDHQAWENTSKLPRALNSESSGISADGAAPRPTNQWKQNKKNQPKVRDQKKMTDYFKKK